ncbi:hypothetical protein CEP52_011415 [Fusarium oligoseptatum]|uniref:Uncharacterized protein n=1 Tax=Fusarium oligoseptatum TaxID=2604345 RepID=A0A428T3A3_9HYPO|nr:hypothetical protein CEP52_011415 [Fusarium oligoseptatum]
MAGHRRLRSVPDLVPCSAAGLACEVAAVGNDSGVVSSDSDGPAWKPWPRTPIDSSSASWRPRRRCRSLVLRCHARPWDSSMSIGWLLSASRIGSVAAITCVQVDEKV